MGVRPLLFNAFVMATPTHHQSGMWRAAHDIPWNPNRLGTWVDLAATLERGTFNAVFFADHLGAPEKFDGSYGEYARQGKVFPTNDPLVITSALAATTTHLGLVVTSSTIQNQPYVLARQISTLDHVSDGRAGWNLVTTALRNSYRNLSYPDLVEHDERYRRAREFVDVTYKLWEGSWDEGAVVRDPVSGTYADPALVHEIGHSGERYSVQGPFLCEPSPQRTPFLFLAGVSDAAVDLAARHAEGWAIVSEDTGRTRSLVERVRSAAVSYGRNPQDVAVFQGLKVVIGSTESEAQQKYAAISAVSDPLSGVVGLGGIIGVDLGGYDLDDPIDLTAAQGVLGPLLSRLPEGADPRAVTLRELAATKGPSESTIVGTPEQIVSRIEQWAATGIDGINLEDYLFHGGYRDFVDQVVPILRRRGLIHEEYLPGTLRERTFGAGAHLRSTHPAASYRGAFA